MTKKPKHEVAPDMLEFRMRNPENSSTDPAYWTDEYYAELLGYAVSQQAEAQQLLQRIDEEIPIAQARRAALKETMYRHLYDDKTSEFDAAVVKYMTSGPRYELLPEFRELAVKQRNKLDRLVDELRRYQDYWARKAAREEAERQALAEREEAERQDREARRKVALAQMSPERRAQVEAEESRWQEMMEHQRKRDEKAAAEAARQAQIIEEAKQWAKQQ